jgi:hypothetical protein
MAAYWGRLGKPWIISAHAVALWSCVCIRKGRLPVYTS